VLLGSVSSFIKPLPLVDLPKIAVVNTLGPIVGVEQIGPSDYHKDYESLGLEFDERIIENLDSAQSRLLGFCNQLSFY
jgi:hypothetical protein